MKKGMWKKVLAAALCVVMVMGLAACGSKDDGKGDTTAAAENGGKNGVLKVGMSGDYPPFEFYAEVDGKKTLVGSDVKLAEYIADALDMELELTDMSFDGLIGSLDEGKFDLVISGMSIKEGRKCEFSDPYYTAEQALLVKAENADKYASLDELNGLKVGGQMGALQQDLADKYAGSGAQIVNNVQDMVMMVSEGKLDGMFCEVCVAQSAVAKNSGLAVASLEVPTDEVSNIAVCIKEGNTEMLEKVNKIIAEVVEKNLYGDWMTEYLDMEEAK
jgi:ABC-type amino acid transport substrate-binding protein